MIPLKFRQAAIILFTIVTVLTIAYFCRTPRPPVASTTTSTESIQFTREESQGNRIPLASTLNATTPNPLQEDRVPDDVVDSPSSHPLTNEELRMKLLETPYIIDKFTIVTPSYKRTDNLYRIFDNYCPMGDIVHKIIILWNNVGVAVPEKVHMAASNCNLPVVVKIMEHNNLTSRFIVYPEIETTAILSIDDDLMLPISSLMSAYNTWKKYPYLLVGYTQRHYSKSKGIYSYDRSGKGVYSMIMTNVAFIHRFYLNLFCSTLPKEILDFIIDTTNGEDLAMNVIIGKYLAEQGLPQPVGIRMTSKTVELGNLSKSGYQGLWHRSKHLNQRSECLNRLAKAYGQLYLKGSSLHISS